ncbi:VirD4-like conjugal transfer protein, CD1115 family [Butyrivibrio sp. XPD2006]|uniref:VirD4-like conjugal transfer protein, CD1115 family n=1 Tax=Butyrivibrio sp. XPD2006 TaxID=1280668 RepID=UPI0003B35529|nr:type IV secretory system conjugative DNA transfer family protein [Butyrivibrio sp. XPD2006]
MKDNMLILAQDQYYSMDCYKTKLNNNVLVVGTSGAGKTRSIVEPNLMMATGSYVISDPKGNLYKKYKDYLHAKGYKVRKLDFTDPEHSAHYNFFRYIHTTQDIVKMAHMMIYQEKGVKTVDPFWDQAAQLLVQACIAYLVEVGTEKDKNFENLMRLIDACEIDENDPGWKTPLDLLMDDLYSTNNSSYAVKTYKKFRVAAGKTLKSILISVNARLGLFDVPEIDAMLETDTINIKSIGDKKTALFVVVSDTDRSLDGLANIFFTQAMNELCRYADKECKDNRLPVPTRFILDDFATNVRINEFPRMISSIRSRGISTMLMIQAEAQLQEAYEFDGKTIIGNCDTYVYLGGNDVETAKAVAERCDVPVKKVLNMPVGTCWIFRRGQMPIYSKIVDFDAFKKHRETSIIDTDERCI